jgi:hypothetical protein
MSTKTKNTKTTSEQLSGAAQQLGLVLMTAAVTLGMAELPEHPNSKVIVPNQPAFAFAHNQGGEAHNDNTLRREREENGPHYVSYNITQRTPGRTGKR